MHINRLARQSGKQRGDTLVEVLIAVTVVSMVLGGAYVTTNKSLLATRAAQERSNALKLTESQVEQLKGLVATNPSAVFATTTPFCIYNQTNILPASDSRCTQNAAGGLAAGEPKFTLSIVRVGNDFTVKNTWVNVSGKVTDKMVIKYRVYQ
jgi:prepilin-type N-terminal cleavage/methylation domain-containing protein